MRRCPFIIKGALGTTSVTAKKIVALSTSRITTAEGPVDCINIQLYLRKKAGKIIQGLPFTDGVGFNITPHLGSNHAKIDGLNFDLRDEVQNVSSVRRIHFASWDGYNVPIQMDPSAT